MRSSLLLLLMWVVLVPSAGAAPARSVTTAGPVVALAMDGRRVAFADGRSAGDCDRVRIWSLQTRRVTTLRRPTSCIRTSTGSGIAGLALAEDRVLWLHYAGGNIREWRLYTATVTSPRPRLLRLVSRDVDAASPIVLGDGNASRFGDFLPYAVERNVVVLRANGSRRFAWRAPERVTALSALFGKLAVATEGGQVTILDGEGAVVRIEQFGGEISALKLSGDGVLVQRGRTLELRHSGVSQAFIIPAGSVLTDAIGERALYSADGRARQLSLSSGVDHPIATGSLVEAELSSFAVASGRRVFVRPLP